MTVFPETLYVLDTDHALNTHSNLLHSTPTNKHLHAVDGTRDETTEIDQILLLLSWSHKKNKVPTKIWTFDLLLSRKISLMNSLKLLLIAFARLNKVYKNLAEVLNHVRHLQWPSTAFEIIWDFSAKCNFTISTKGVKNPINYNIFYFREVGWAGSWHAIWNLRSEQVSVGQRNRPAKFQAWRSSFKKIILDYV